MVEVRASAPVLVRLVLAGRFALISDGRQITVPHSAQRVLASLALARHPLHRSTLAGMLWSGTTERRATSNLRSALWRLNGVQVGLLVVRDSMVTVAPHVVVDVHELESLARRLANNPDDSSLDQLPDLLTEAELLPDWDEDWLVADRERLRSLRIDALEGAAASLFTRGQLTDALFVATAAIQAEPLHESTQRLIVQTHLARGNVAEAVRCYFTYFDLLRVELGIRPSPRMEQLIAPLLRHDPVPAHR